MCGVKGQRKRDLSRNATRDRIWQSMRIMRRFSIPDLVSTAEAGESNTKKFVRSLLQAGYLRIALPKQNGKKGGYAVYLLIRNSGPHAPRLQQDGLVWDPNTNTTHGGNDGQVG